MTTSESKGRFFTKRIESIRIANWNALLNSAHVMSVFNFVTGGTAAWYSYDIGRRRFVGICLCVQRDNYRNLWRRKFIFGTGAQIYLSKVRVKFVGFSRSSGEGHTSKPAAGSSPLGKRQFLLQSCLMKISYHTSLSSLTDIWHGRQLPTVQL